MSRLPIKQGTAVRLGLHPPTKDRRRHAKRRNRARIDFGSIALALPASIAAPPPDPAVRYIPVPYERGMLR